MVPVDNVRLFPIIVNYSPSQKVDEFKFDKVDYTKLIGSKKPL